MVLHEFLYIMFFSVYPLSLSIIYGLHIEVVIFFLHILYPFFVTLPLFLHFFNILCIVYLTLETYQRHFFFESTKFPGSFSMKSVLYAMRPNSVFFNLIVVGV